MNDMRSIIIDGIQTSNFKGIFKVIDTNLGSVPSIKYVLDVLKNLEKEYLAPDAENQGAYLHLISILLMKGMRKCEARGKFYLTTHYFIYSLLEHVESWLSAILRLDPPTSDDQKISFAKCAQAVLIRNYAHISSLMKASMKSIQKKISRIVFHGHLPIKVKEPYFKLICQMAGLSESKMKMFPTEPHSEPYIQDLNRKHCLKMFMHIIKVQQLCSDYELDPVELVEFIFDDFEMDEKEESVAKKHFYRFLEIKFLPQSEKEKVPVDKKELIRYIKEKFLSPSEIYMDPVAKEIFYRYIRKKHLSPNEKDIFYKCLDILSMSQANKMVFYRLYETDYFDDDGVDSNDDNDDDDEGVVLDKKIEDGDGEEEADYHSFYKPTIKKLDTGLRGDPGHIETNNSEKFDSKDEENYCTYIETNDEKVVAKEEGNRSYCKINYEGNDDEDPYTGFIETREWYSSDYKTSELQDSPSDEEEFYTSYPMKCQDDPFSSLKKYDREHPYTANPNFYSTIVELIYQRKRCNYFSAGYEPNIDEASLSQHFSSLKSSD